MTSESLYCSSSSFGVVHHRHLVLLSSSFGVVHHRHLVLFIIVIWCCYHRHLVLFIIVIWCCSSSSFGVVIIVIWCCSSSSFDEDDADAADGEIRRIESYQFEPKWMEIGCELTVKPNVSNTGVRAQNGSLFFLFFTKTILRATGIINVHGFIHRYKILQLGDKQLIWFCPCTILLTRKFVCSDTM